MDHRSHGQGGLHPGEFLHLRGGESGGLPSGGLPPRGMPPGGVCIQEGLHQSKVPRSAYGGLGRPPRDTWDTTGYDQVAGGTHPIGMHSCLRLITVFSAYSSFVLLYFRE